MCACDRLGCCDWPAGGMPVSACVTTTALAPHSACCLPACLQEGKPKAKKQKGSGSPGSDAGDQREEKEKDKAAAAAASEDEEEDEGSSSSEEGSGRRSSEYLAQVRRWRRNPLSRRQHQPRCRAHAAGCRSRQRLRAGCCGAPRAAAAVRVLPPCRLGAAVSPVADALCPVPPLCRRPPQATSFALKQEREAWDAPPFDCAAGPEKPMMELQAGSRVYYQVGAGW